MRHGEIRWYRFARPDKRRPVLLLTRDSAIPHLAEVTVAPITSTIRDIPSEVLLSRLDGMSRDCVVNLDHLQTVPKSKIGAVVTQIGPGRLLEVRQALLFALQLERP